LVPLPPVVPLPVEGASGVDCPAGVSSAGVVGVVDGSDGSSVAVGVSVGPAGSVGITGSRVESGVGVPVGSSVGVVVGSGVGVVVGSGVGVTVDDSTLL